MSLARYDDTFYGSHCSHIDIACLGGGGGGGGSMQNRRRNHLLLLASHWICVDVWEVTAAMTQKHVKTVKRRKRRASDTDVTKSIQVVQTHVLLVRCKCTKNFLH